MQFRARPELGHLTYCTNIHPGETWEEIFESLETYVLPLKQALSPNAPFAIGLRLSDQASRVLIEPDKLAAFQTCLLHNYTSPHPESHRQTKCRRRCR